MKPLDVLIDDKVEKFRGVWAALAKGFGAFNGGSLERPRSNFTFGPSSFSKNRRDSNLAKMFLAEPPNAQVVASVVVGLS